MTFKLVKYINPIGEIQSFTKTNCNMCTEERLPILKNLRDKKITLMKNVWKYTGPSGTKNFPLIFPKHW